MVKGDPHKIYWFLKDSKKAINSPIQSDCLRCSKAFPQTGFTISVSPLEHQPKWKFSTPIAVEE